MNRSFGDLCGKNWQKILVVALLRLWVSPNFYRKSHPKQRLLHSNLNVQQPLLFYFLVALCSFFPLSTYSESGKSAATLTEEARELLQSSRPLEARAKLMEAIIQDEDYYPAHLLLAEYYLNVVGHFRLAVQYVLKGQEIFIKVHGKPPYEEFSNPHLAHPYILYLLAQTRLNLDNYQGTLEVLDEYERLKYVEPWYRSTKAWTLMKLGRLKEAVLVAKEAVALGDSSGRILNMLGILLSMNGETEEAYKTFEVAISTEFALGSFGQPATPLNNIGEVYKEQFLDSKAREVWNRISTLPDGCEHVLPSLNLALLEVDWLRLSQATQVLNDFLSCFAQYTQRNDEEHQALVKLARGRIALYSGNVDESITLLKAATESLQWFGKIGTSINDLMAGSLHSLSIAYESAKNREHLSPSLGLFSNTRSLFYQLDLAWKSAWSKRRALHVLIDEGNNLEDLKIRNTDSMLEYPTLGRTLSGGDLVWSTRKITRALEDDKRPESKLYYRTYLLEIKLNNRWFPHSFYSNSEILSEIESLLQSGVQLPLLRVTLLGMKLSLLTKGTPEYVRTVTELFRLNPAEVLNRGFYLPIKAKGKGSKIFRNTPFFLDTTNKTPVTLTLEKLPQSIIDEKETYHFAVTLSGLDFLRDPRGGSFRTFGESESVALKRAINRLFSS
jgi:Tfp pilus assembly protein PilF